MAINNREKLIVALSYCVDNWGWAISNHASKLLDIIQVDEQKHSLSFSEENSTQVSYTINNKRIRGKLSRYIRKHLKIGPEIIADNILSNLCNNITALNTPMDGCIRIVSGEDITRYYEIGFGCKSCMCGYNANLTKFYTNNPEKVSLLLYDADVQARALLWTLDSGERYLDRIYASNENILPTIRLWAKYNDVLTCLPRNITVTMKGMGNDPYPYIDTFFYLTELKNEEVRLSNSSGDHELHNQCGYYVNSITCCCCDGTVLTGEANEVNGDYYCDNCFCDNFTSCSECGEATQIEYSTIVEDTKEVLCESCVESIEECIECTRYYREGIVGGHCEECRRCLVCYGLCEKENEIVNKKCDKCSYNEHQYLLTLEDCDVK